jgi:TonB-linked SusC/RagA family outer membrane protein
MFMMVAAFSWLNAQTTNIIQGTVKDKKGEPIIGAAVAVKGTSLGTVTDADGKFALAAPSDATTLVIKYIGYKPQEVAIANANGNIDVALEEEAKNLDEIVVTALGVKRERKSLGYSTQQISGSDVTDAKDANLVNDLEGKIAGVQVTGNGNIGGSSRIVIRGIKSLTGENQPLFVVDGVPIDNSNFATADVEQGSLGFDYGNAAQDINADDIESVNVLKAGPAAALYGSRGYNGVIMITTKKGSKHAKGKNNSPIGVSVSENFMVNQVAVLPKYQNEYGAGYGPSYNVDENDPTQIRLRMQDDGSWGPAIDGRLVRQYPSYDPTDPLYGKATPYISHPNNVKDFFRTGFLSNTNVAFDGANDNGSFRMSYSNLGQQGTVPNSSLKRNSISFNGEYNFNSHIFASIGANYVHDETVGRPAVGYNSVFSNFTQWFERQLDMGDLRNYKNADGSQRTWNLLPSQNADGSFSYVPYYWNNPYWQIYENYQNDHRDRIFGNAEIGYHIIKGLTAKFKVSTDRYSEERNERVAKGSAVAGGLGVGIPQYSREQINVSENNYEGTLTYENSFKHDFDLYAMVGANLRDNRSEDNYSSTQGGLNVPDWYNLANSTDKVLTKDKLYTQRVNSIFGSASLGWRHMLYLDLTERIEWSSSLYSSQYPTRNMSYNYPSVTGSFVFSELIKNNKVLSFGKIRGGWTSVAHAPAPQSTSTLQQPSTSFGSSPMYYVPYEYNDPNIKPEQIHSWEIGTDLSFFMDRITIDASYYNSITTNNIIRIEQTGASGINYRYTNAGVLTNQGVELSTTFVPVKTKSGFKWSVGFNFAKNYNLVKELYKDASGFTVNSLSLGTDGFGRATIEAIPGMAYGQIVGYDFVYDKSGQKIVGPDGQYLVSSTVKPLGSILPDFTGGVSTTLSYKGLSLFVLFDFQKGGHLFSMTNMWGAYDGTLAITADNGIRVNGLVVPGVAQAVDGAGNPILDANGNPTSTGQKNTVRIAAIDYFQNGTGNGYGGPSKQNVYDATFVKFRELKLMYALPSKLFDKTPIKGVSFGLIGRNLAILKKNVPNIDPESASSTSNTQGIEGGVKPTERSIGFNVSVKF